MTAHEIVFMVTLGPFLFWLCCVLSPPKAPKIIRRLWVMEPYTSVMEEEREVTLCLVKAAWPFRTYHL